MRIPIFLRVGHATVRCLRGDLELRIFVINKAVHYHVSRINYSKSIFFSNKMEEKTSHFVQLQVTSSFIHIY